MELRRNPRNTNGSKASGDLYLTTFPLLARDTPGYLGAFGTMQLVRGTQAQNRRLDSWKEIAAFFDRDERTVKRWEKERSLPVHRLPGGARGRVFAFSDELARWMQSSDLAGQDAPPVRLEEPARFEGDGPRLPVSSNGSLRLVPVAPRLAKTRWIAAAICATVVLAALALVLAYRRDFSLTRIQHSPITTDATPRQTSAAFHPNPEAQEFYLKGRYYWNKRTPADLTKAVDFFTQAIVHDPNYAQAYVGLADSYNLLREYAAMPSEEAFPRALAAAKKAVELDDSSAEAHASLAFVTFYWKWDMVAAEREFRRAIELNPNYVAAHHWYATSLILLGRLPEALQEIDRAQQLDPASTSILADKALILFHQGHLDQATALLKQIEVSQPSFFSTHRYLSYVYFEKGDIANYLAEATKSAIAARDERELAILRAAEQGWKSGGERGMLENTLRMQKKFYAEGQMSAFPLAATCARLGRSEEALQYLQASYDRHEPYFLGIRADQNLVSLHGDPAFQNLVAKAGLPPLP